jgi:hypothetical protein
MHKERDEVHGMGRTRLLGLLKRVLWLGGCHMCGLQGARVRGVGGMSSANSKLHRRQQRTGEVWMKMMCVFSGHHEPGVVECDFEYEYEGFGWMQTTSK